MSYLNTIKMFVSKNLPTILSGMALATSTAAVVECAHATFTAKEKLDKLHYESETEPTFQVKFCTIAPIYTKTAILLAMSWAEILGAQMENDKRIAVLTGLVQMKEKELNETEAKVKELFGEKKADQVKKEIIKDHIKADPPTDDKFDDTGTGKTKFYDTTLGGYFLADIEFVKHAFNDIENRLINNTIDDDLVTVNDLMYALKRETSSIGNRLIWPPGTSLNVRISQEEYDNVDIYDVTNNDIKNTIWCISYEDPHELRDFHLNTEDF